jgi:putative phosphoribosyl transferase
MTQRPYGEPNERVVEIPAGRRRVRGILSLPGAAVGVVAFAHGSGSGRFSPRNQFVAGVLRKAGIATLLIDLLEEDEADDRRKVFDIELLATRLQAASDWLGQHPETASLRLGYFGASTGAGAALVAAARAPEAVHAVVSRGGRPDLAYDDLPAVTAPTLLIVGGSDEEVLELNRGALAMLKCPKELVVVPGATHLFEEPGTLEEVARLATQWFLRHLEPEAAHGPDQLGARFPRRDMEMEC